MSLQWLSLLSWLIDELDFVNAEVGVSAGRRLDSAGGVAGEVPGEGSGASARVERGDDEADPADDVVLGVRSRAGQQAVDGEEHLFAAHGAEGVLELRVVEVRRRRGVIRAKRQLVFIPVQQPVGERSGADIPARIAVVQIEQTERACPAAAARLV